MKTFALIPQSPVLFFVSCFLLIACKNDSEKETIKDASPYFTNFFTGNEAAVLRDISFNITSDELKKTEKAKLYEATADHLFYEFTFPKDSTAFSEYANVQYFFNEEDQLDIITADIFLNDSIQEKRLKENLTTYYQLRFGDPEKDDNDHEVWNAAFTDSKTDKKNEYTVALKETTGDFGVSLEYVRK